MKQLLKSIGARLAAAWSALVSGYPSGGYAGSVSEFPPNTAEPGRFCYIEGGCKVPTGVAWFGADAASKPAKTRLELFAANGSGRELRAELIGERLSDSSIAALFAGFDESWAGFAEPDRVEVEGAPARGGVEIGDLAEVTTIGSELREFAPLKGSGIYYAAEDVLAMIDRAGLAVFGEKMRGVGDFVSLCEQSSFAYSMPIYRALRANDAEPGSGSWYKAEEVNALVRRLDVALNGELGAARQAMLCDVVGQVEDVSRSLRRPVIAAAEASEL